MPDWFYQPIYKPIVTNLLSAESARRLTMFAMRIQSQFSIGRKLFDLLSRTSPPIVIPQQMRTEVFGLSFPTPIGLAHGIDREANALPLWSMLGLGFVQIGVLDILGTSSSQFANETRLLPQYQAIVTSKKAYTSCLDDIVKRLRENPNRSIPIGVALHDSHIVETLNAIEADADFFSVASDVALDLSYLEAIRASTEKPLLLRLTISHDDTELERAIENAVQVGFDGCIVIDGQESNLAEDALIYGSHLRENALSWVTQIVERYGDTFPVIGSGGILSPNDAITFLEAGAKLVQLYEGLIYAGPGLPRRIVHDIIKPKSIPNKDEAQKIIPATNKNTLGWRMILFVGSVLIFGGLLGILGAIIFQLLPYELSYVQMTFAELESYFDGRLAGFIFHDRISYHGTLISYGILYSWLAWKPLHPNRTEAWAWWALFISGTIGASSTFISYIFSNYFDPWYGSIAITLIAIFYTGLILSYRSMSNPPRLSSLWKAGSRIWLWSAAGIGRSYCLFWAATTALAGLLIFYTGMTQVFVEEDLAFIQTSVASIQQISPRLIPFIAHDRIGFGITLLAIGTAALVIVWKGIRPDSKSALLALSLAYFVSNLTAIWVHPIVGYNSFTHLLPFLVKDSAFLFAIFHLYRPMMVIKSTTAFPEL